MSDPKISQVWNMMNNWANALYGMSPKKVRDALSQAADKLLVGPARKPDSGDFVDHPSFVNAGVIANFIRRYVGSPMQRTYAWEELAVFLNRWGWRMSDLAYTQAYRILEADGLLPPVQKESDILFESANFRVIVPAGLLIDRTDGGHLVIYPHFPIHDRIHFSDAHTLEYCAFTKAVGRAFIEVMNESGIPVERLSFMDMGNWKLLTPKKPHFHLHVFGRARGSRFQIHGEFNHLPPKGSKHYELIEPINEVERAKLRERIPEYFDEEARKIFPPRNTPPSSQNNAPPLCGLGEDQGGSATSAMGSMCGIMDLIGADSVFSNMGVFAAVSSLAICPVA